MTYRYSDLVDIPKLQKLMTSFHKLTGIIYAVLDNHGNLLCINGWQDICTNFHRVCSQTEYNCKKSDRYISEHLQDGHFIGYKCLNGLMDYSTPIIVEGQHLATIFTGQLLHEPPDEEFFRRQALKYGFDETAYIEALRRVPIISKDQVEFTMIFFSQLAQLLAAMGLERKHQLEAADKVLTEREELLKLVLKESQEGFWDYNVETGDVYYSPRWVEMLGYSLEEIAPHIRTWEKLLHPEDKHAVMKVLNDYLEGNTALFETEYRLLSRSGEWKWVMARGEIIMRDKNGKPLRMAGTQWDLTEHKQDEKLLRLSEERFYKAFNASPNLMAIITIANLRYVDVNNSFLLASGYSREEVIGSTETELNILTDISHDHKTILQIYQKHGACCNLEVKTRNKSGEVRIGLFSTDIIEVGGERCLISVINDITELRKMEKEMARLDRLHLVGEMAAGIGHEIRNPMTSVRGFLQLFLGREEFDKYKSSFEVMIEELDRANSIITEYLTLAKNKKLDRIMQKLNIMIKAIFPLIQADAMKNDKYIKLELTDLPELLLDEKEIRQLLHNLVRNGLEAMEPGGCVTIRTFLDGAEAVLAVIDQGQGIKPEALKMIGTPFFTTKDTGTGLGLATCYSIADRHNAKIDIETSPAGTTFYVRFKIN
ncbi:MAG: Sporulation kinase E [Pelotomaculum sp. PtaB.Bin104]|nr:MAG: Sporulation kinase E [Pelotomaculum sp. PtaB.Bin104]